MKVIKIENPENLSDSELIQKCLEKGEHYYQIIYMRYRKQLYNTAYRILKDSDKALDAVQDSFINAYKNLKNFKGDAELAYWLKKIVINISLNQLKKEKRFTSLLTEDIEVSDNDEYTQDIDEHLLQIENIKYAMEKLPKGYSLVFQLKLFEGLEHSEIAEYLNISESTSKTQYKKAKQRIVELLNTQKS